MESPPPSPRHVPCMFWHETYEMKSRKRKQQKEEVSENETIPDGFLDEVVSEPTLSPTSPAKLHPFSPQGEQGEEKEEEDMVSDGELAKALAVLQEERKKQDSCTFFNVQYVFILSGIEKNNCCTQEFLCFIFEFLSIVRYLPSLYIFGHDRNSFILSG